ncbi:hypothetical protein [Actinokineospora spheciospongiae]|uniref:hypothetical protein n=1 Tax=Actinokineospora spheciospongiae TaxID=909613 RepID=UPI000D712047|nr:hypothetical protein [Actinokineospora spheciospongiae]PWW64671.1 hypothetical protein DFQ13_103645 [Actinokineospora spheciospongiae]
MNLLDHIASVAALAGRADHDPRALAADEHLRFEWYRAADPVDERAFLELVLLDPDREMATAAVVARIDERGRARGDFHAWAARVGPVVEHVEFLRRRLAEWRLLRDALAGRPVQATAVLAASDWAQRRLAAEVDGDLLALLAVHGRTRRVRALTRVPRPVRRPREPDSGY